MPPQRFLVATRKGLFDFRRSPAPNGSWQLARTSFLGEPVTIALPDPRDGSIYAALNLGHFGVKLHRSEDGGESWEELSPPAHPGQDGDDDSAPSVKLIWELTPGGPDQPGRLWAGTLPGGLFRSGVRIGGEALGKELAAYMGSLYGFLAGTAGVAVGLIVLLLIGG